MQFTTEKFQVRQVKIWEMVPAHTRESTKQGFGKTFNVDLQFRALKHDFIATIDESAKRTEKYDEDVDDAAIIALGAEARSQIPKDDYASSMEIFIQCKDLPRLDSSTPDPHVIVYLQQELNYFL